MLGESEKAAAIALEAAGVLHGNGYDSRAVSGSGEVGLDRQTSHA